MCALSGYDNFNNAVAYCNGVTADGFGLCVGKIMHDKTWTNYNRWLIYARQLGYSELVIVGTKRFKLEIFHLE